VGLTLISFAQSLQCFRSRGCTNINLLPKGFGLKVVSFPYVYLAHFSLSCEISPVMPHWILPTTTSGIRLSEGDLSPLDLTSKWWYQSPGRLLANVFHLSI